MAAAIVAVHHIGAEPPQETDARRKTGQGPQELGGAERLARLYRCAAGARIGDLSHAIGTVLTEAGYPVNTQFGGHGIGSTAFVPPERTMSAIGG